MVLDGNVTWYSLPPRWPAPVALPRTEPPPAPTAARYVMPDGPGGPAGPTGPRREVRTELERSSTLMLRSRSSDEPTARLRISLEATAFLRICVEPTLLRGNLSAA